MRGEQIKVMKHMARRLLTLLAVIVAGALSGGLVGEFFMGGWGAVAIFGGIVAAFLGMLYDPRATTYTVPIRGGAEYPGNRDDRAPQYGARDVPARSSATDLKAIARNLLCA